MHKDKCTRFLIYNVGTDAIHLEGRNEFGECVTIVDGNLYEYYTPAFVPGEKSTVPPSCFRDLEEFTLPCHTESSEMHVRDPSGRTILTLSGSIMPPAPALF